MYTKCNLIHYVIHAMSNLSKIPIGRFSTMTQLSTKALRLYDEKGILIPSEKDPVTGYRYYTLQQVEMGLKIRMLVSLGFGLEEVTLIILAMKDGNGDLMKEMFLKCLERTRGEIARLKKIEQILLEKHQKLEMFYLSSTEPVVKEIPRLRILSIREVGDFNIFPRLIGTLFKEISSKDNQRNFVHLNGPVMYICHDDEFKPTDADIEVAIPITGRVHIQNPEIELRNLPRGPVVSSIYTGPYKQITEAYTRTHAHLLEHGYEMRAPTMELYLNNPEETPEDELLTEIQIPIKQP